MAELYMYFSVNNGVNVQYSIAVIGLSEDYSREVCSVKRGFNIQHC